MTAETERPIVKKTLMFGVVSIIIGVMLPILSLMLPLQPEGESLGEWFQRSGSVMVAVAVWAEVKLSGIHSILNPTGLYTNDCEKLRNDYGTYYTYLVILVAIVATIGTLIWGYGDLIIGNK